MSSTEEGRNLFAKGEYEQAAKHFWQAILFHSKAKVENNNQEVYSVKDAFDPFLQCYSNMGSVIDAYLFIAKESIGRKQWDMASVYIKQAFHIDANSKEVMLLKVSLDQEIKMEQELRTKAINDEQIQKATEFYNLGTKYFDAKNFEAAAEAFDRSCEIGKGNIDFGGACTNAVYCRSNIMKWGFNGTQFEKDMETIETITQKEVDLFRSVDSDGQIHWKRSTSAHPHMMLGYPLKNSMLKRYVAESYAALDEPQARYKLNNGNLLDLPSDLPFDHKNNITRFDGDKLRIGFVSSAFSSKAVLYLSYKMFDFFNGEKVEVHIYSIGKPDSSKFIENSMRGVDWRERVKSNVDMFHDVQSLKHDHISLARKIYDDKIQILIEWDGYARQGFRAQGLFALRPAPIQILHQEFLGSTGGDFVDYIITDQVTSPESLQKLYVEKFIYLPNHFFSKGHAIQSEVKRPTYKFQPKEIPYKLGTGTPQENRCLSESEASTKEVSFVYCNFNKFLKLNPETIMSWIEILRNVPNSIICLLENPPSGIPYLRHFVNDVASQFDDGDNGEDLNSRIHFLSWQANPFDHQMRSQDFCNVVLDSYPYNGHTTGVDALFGGVPIITRSDGEDMASRVTTSGNKVLGLEKLNAKSPSQLVDIAIKMGTNAKYFQSIRKRLIATCLKQNPMHPYWDVKRYVRNFERGLFMAWDNFVNNRGMVVENIYVKETRNINIFRKKEEL